MQIIDLSQSINAQMPRFSESAPQPRISAWMSHEEAVASGRYEGCSCEVTEVQFVTSISTYIDSPYHFVPDGPAIHELRLEQCVLPGICVDCRPLTENQHIDARFFENLDVAGKAVLICTGWSAYWGQDVYARYPFIGREAAEILRDGGAKLVGVDYLAIDDQSDPQRPVHTTLLRAGVLIVENLTGLEVLIGREFMFHAAPVKVQGAAAFPVRAYANSGLEQAVAIQPGGQLVDVGFGNHRTTINAARTAPAFQRFFGHDGQIVPARCHDERRHGCETRPIDDTSVCLLVAVNVDFPIFYTLFGEYLLGKRDKCTGRRT